MPRELRGTRQYAQFWLQRFIADELPYLDFKQTLKVYREPRPICRLEARRCWAATTAFIC